MLLNSVTWLLCLLGEPQITDELEVHRACDS
jgi:hypothetical protein